MVSRRPAESTHRAVRSGVASRWRRRSARGSSARRLTAAGGQGGEVRMRAFAGQRQARQAAQAGVEGLVVQEQGVGRQHRAFRVGLQELPAVAGVLGKPVDGRRGVAQRDGDGVGRQVVEQRGGLLEEQRQVVFDAGEGDAVADVLVGQGARRVALEDFAETRAEAIARGLVHGEFAARQQFDFTHRIQAALGVAVEAADGFDLAVEQVDAVGQGRAHGEQVDQAAADAEFAGRADLGDVAVVGQGQLGAQAFLVQGVALAEMEGVGRQEGRRGQADQGGGDRHHQDVHGALAQGVQGAQAFGNQVLVRGKAVVGQGFPVGQEAHAQVRIEQGDFVGQATGGQRVGAEGGQRVPGLARQRGQQQGVAGARRTGLDVALAGAQGGQGGADRGQG